jgi:hypothetical protein
MPMILSKHKTFRNRLLFRLNIKGDIPKDIALK